MADFDGRFDRARTLPRMASQTAEIGGRTIAERLSSAIRAIGGRFVFTTSFGAEGQLILHHILAQGLPVDVVTFDTGRLFPETYELWQETEERYGVRIRAIYPDSSLLSDLVADQGINGFYHSRDARFSCCHVRKVEPLRRVLKGATAWVTGLRADQSQRRSKTRLASWDNEHALVKVAPLFDHSRDQVLAECSALGVPINALHAQGFLSIGCAPCTRAVRPGEPERAGRWWWETDGSGECGLHLDPSERPLRSRAA